MNISAAFLVAPWLNLPSVSSLSVVPFWIAGESHQFDPKAGKINLGEGEGAALAPTSLTAMRCP